MIIEENSNLRQKLTRADIEIARLIQENQKLQMNIDRLQSIKEMEPPLPNHSSLRDSVLQDPSDPLDKSQSPETGFTSQSVLVEVAEIKNKLEQTETQLQQTKTQLQETQTQLQQTQAELRQTQAELQLNPKSNNQMKSKDNEVCKDQKPKKKCENLKKKNNGKGCKKKGTRKNCKRTCGLCDNGKTL